MGAKREPKKTNGAFGPVKPENKPLRNIRGQIQPDFYVVWTLFPGFWGQGVHFWGQKTKNIGGKKIAKEIG